MIKPAGQFTLQEIANQLGVPFVVKLVSLEHEVIVRPNDDAVSLEIIYCQACGEAPLATTDEFWNGFCQTCWEQA